MCSSVHFLAIDSDVKYRGIDPESAYDQILDAGCSPDIDADTLHHLLPCDDEFCMSKPSRPTLHVFCA